MDPASIAIAKSSIKKSHLNRTIKEASSIVALNGIGTSVRKALVANSIANIGDLANLTDDQVLTLKEVKGLERIEDLRARARLVLEHFAGAAGSAGSSRAPTVSSEDASELGRTLGSRNASRESQRSGSSSGSASKSARPESVASCGDDAVRPSAAGQGRTTSVSSTRSSAASTGSSTGQPAAAATATATAAAAAAAAAAPPPGTALERSSSAGGMAAAHARTRRSRNVNTKGRASGKYEYALDEVKVGGLRFKSQPKIRIKFVTKQRAAGTLIMTWLEAAKGGVPGTPGKRTAPPGGRPPGPPASRASEDGGDDPGMQGARLLPRGATTTAASSVSAASSLPSPTAAAAAEAAADGADGGVSMFKRGDPRSSGGGGGGGGGASMARGSGAGMGMGLGLPGAGAAAGSSAGSSSGPRRVVAELRVDFEDVASVLVQDRMWEMLLKKDRPVTVTRSLAEAEGEDGAAAGAVLEESSVRPRLTDRHLLLRVNFKSSSVAESKGQMLAEQPPLRGRVLLADAAMELVADFYGGEYQDGEVSFALVRRLPHLAFVKIHDSEKLGDGANGLVSRVITVDGRELRALKCIEDKKSLKTVVLEEGENVDKLRASRGLTEAFRQEVEMQRRVQHPNVLRLFSAHFTSTATYLELELANALDLYEWVAERPFAEAEARAPFYRLTEGVAAMHTTGLCHRDIKLENILCEGSRGDRGASRLILADFDTARYVGLSQRASTYAGTTAYMAPEVANLKHQHVSEGQRKPGAMSWGGFTVARRVHYNAFASDVWSLGVVLTLMLLQEFPFQGDDDLRVMYYDRRSSNLRRLSRDAQALIAGMLEMDPERRLTITQVLTHPWFDTVRAQVASIAPERLHEALMRGTRGEYADWNAAKSRSDTPEAGDADAAPDTADAPAGGADDDADDADDAADAAVEDAKAGASESKVGEAEAKAGK